MLDLVPSRFPVHYIVQFQHLRVTRVQNGQYILAYTDPPLIQLVIFHPGDFGITYRPSVIRINHRPIIQIEETNILRILNNHIDWLFKVKRCETAPIVDIINPALSKRNPHLVIILEIDINHSIIECQHTTSIVLDIIHAYFCIGGHSRLPILPILRFIGNIPQKGESFCSGTGLDTRIGTPPEIHHTSVVGLLVTMRPPAFIALLQHPKRTNCEIFPIRRPAYTRDYVIKRARGK